MKSEATPVRAPVVAIVGRPNVGKSTLFNRLSGIPRAAVADEPGVTRDVNFATTEELGRTITLVDTGGFEPDTTDRILAKVKEQASVAIEDAHVVVFIMDGRAGLTPQDEEIARVLRKSGKPVVYAVNKVDSARLEGTAGEFYALGAENVISISAEQGRNLDVLMDTVVALLPPPSAEEAPEETGAVRVAVLGRPNAGKSSILNRLLGRERSIVSEVAGTTRDAVDTETVMDGRRYVFIDTAGIRKKSRVSLRLEAYCVMEAIRSIDRCDVAVLVIDGERGIGTQDEKIAGLIEDRRKCCVIVVNKWDLVTDKDTSTMAHITRAIRDKVPFLSYAPVVFVSALTGQRVDRVLDSVNEVTEMAARRISTGELNRVFDGIKHAHRPPIYKGRQVKLYYITQSGTSPPTFVVFTNRPEGVPPAYRRYVTGRLREAAGLDKVPIKLFFRKRR